MRTDFRLGEWLVQPELNRVRGSEGDVHLEPRVMDVLVYLARHAREVLPKERVIQAVWSDAFVSDEVLSRAVKGSRGGLAGDRSRLLGPACDPAVELVDESSNAVTTLGRLCVARA
jgi:DNA-binding winged helix-turn-helix (wHTH) protein